MSVGITLTFLFLGELVLVAGGLAYYFYRKWQGSGTVDLEAEILKAKQEAAAEVERSSFNAPLALQFLIDETRRYLQLDGSDRVKNSELSDEHIEMLQLRINYLQAECKSLDGQGLKTNTQWGQLYEHLMPLTPKEHAVDGEVNPGLWKDAQALCGVIKSQLSSYMDKVDDLIKKLSEGGDIDEETLAELQAANEFRDALIDQLSSLSALAGANLSEDDLEGAETVSDMDKLKNMLGGQKSAMDNLMNSLGDDEMKESLPEIEAQLAEIERASKELKMCVDVLKMDAPKPEPVEEYTAEKVATDLISENELAEAKDESDDALIQELNEKEPIVQQESKSQEADDPLFPKDEDVLFAEIDVESAATESGVDKLTAEPKPEPKPEKKDKDNQPEVDFDDLVFDVDLNEDEKSVVATASDSERSEFDLPEGEASAGADRINEQSGRNKITDDDDDEGLIADFDIDDLLVENKFGPAEKEPDPETEEEDQEQYVNDAELDAILDAAIEDIDIK